MVTDVTVIAQQESPWVRGLPAGLTHSALEAPPTFAENHFSDLEKKQSPRGLYITYTMRMTEYTMELNMVLMYLKAEKRQN